MLSYYFNVAVRGLARDAVLSALIVAAIGLGIGASMTVVAMFRATSGDPIPEKSTQLWAPQIDSWGPDKHSASSSERADGLQDQLTYIDAMALQRAHAAKRQAAMYRVSLTAIPADEKSPPFIVEARATYADFFPMFNVPFQYGAPWRSEDDAQNAAVVVISGDMNDRLFRGANSVGKIITLDGEDYRIAGVLRDWRPAPRFYDLNANRFGQTEQVFLPFTHAIAGTKQSIGDMNCNRNTPDWSGLLQSDCVWIQFWVELPTTADQRRYREFLARYASEQQLSGRFHWKARTELRDVLQWLKYEQVVSDELRVMVLTSFGFLFVCLLNATGLMLAKVMSLKTQIATQRALGASRGMLVAQSLVEAGLIGCAGGLLGLLLTLGGLVAMRALFVGSQDVLRLAQLDSTNVGLAMLMAIVATALAGLYPTWRAVQVHPASELKVS
jgi:putative ABC transport system permease protein